MDLPPCLCVHPLRASFNPDGCSFSVEDKGSIYLSAGMIHLSQALWFGFSSLWPTLGKELWRHPFCLSPSRLQLPHGLEVPLISFLRGPHWDEKGSPRPTCLQPGWSQPPLC